MHVPSVTTLTIDNGNSPKVQPPRKLLHTLLECLRLAFLPVAPVLYLLTFHNTARLIIVLWIVGRFAVPYSNEYYLLSFPFIILCGIVLKITLTFASPLRRLVRYMVRALWRPQPPPPPKEEIFASVVIIPMPDPEQHRTRLTSRLSPELQKLIAQRG
jgi:hypothetical protein